MSVKTLKLNCSCDTQLCSHAMDGVAELIQSTYDDGYDEGWNEAFDLIKSGLTEMGYPAANMKVPPPPPRGATKAKKLRSPGTNSLEKIH